MARIPDYVPQQTLQGGATGAKADPTPMFYLESEKEQLAQKASALAEKVNSQFKEAEDLKTVMAEENAMMEHFEGMRKKAAESPTEEAYNGYKNEADLYFQGLSERHKDKPRVLAQLQNKWTFYRESGAQAVWKDWRERVLQETTATLNDGNDKFLNAAYGMPSEKVYVGLTERFKNIDEMVSKGTLRPDLAQTMKDKLGQSVDRSLALRELESNPKAALQFVSNPKNLPYMDSSERSNFINTIQRQIKSDEAEARREARIAKMEREQNFHNNVVNGAATALKGYIETGKKSKEYEVYKNLVAENKDLTAAKTLRKMFDEAEADMPVLVEAQGLSLKELGAKVNDLASRNQAGNLSGVEQRQFEKLKGLHEGMQGFAASGDFLSFYQRIGKDVGSLDPNAGISSEDIAKRRTWMGVGKNQFGVEPLPLTKKEAAAFRESLENANPQQKEQLLGVLGALTATTKEDGTVTMDRKRAENLLRAVGGKEGSLTTEIFARIQGDPGSKLFADNLAKGRDLQKNVKESFPSREKMKAKVHEDLRGLGIELVDPNGESASQLVNSVVDAYVGKNPQGFGEFDMNTQGTIKEFFGLREDDELLKMKGKNLLPAYPGQRQSEFDKTWLWMNDDIFAKAASSAKAFTFEGSTATPKTLSEIKKKGWLAPIDGEGNYVIQMPRASGFWGDDTSNPLLVKDENGKAVVINIRKATKEVNALSDSLSVYQRNLYETEQKIKKSRGE
jgi:hypothetical protein